MTEESLFLPVVVLQQRRLKDDIMPAVGLAHYVECGKIALFYNNGFFLSPTQKPN